MTDDAGDRQREGLIANVSAALLTGGASRRMGFDKTYLELDGERLATRLARQLAAHFEEVLVVGGVPPAETPGRVTPDVEGPICALRGIVSALSAAGSERVLVVAADLPRLGPELLLTLVAWPEADVVLPCRDERVEPLCAIWSRAAVLPPARAALAAGRLALHELIASLRVERLEREDLHAVDPSDRMLANANTPEEWARITALAGESDAVG